ncbi:HAMP domain-containing histidine kinase [Rhizobium sp. P40RR-XXII]|uniref:sensor histidine kinase n=1 Tax=unclassified Rhizobium TaxID=2613769 RepID=UPI0014577F12|nr:MULTISPECIES: HAMP domain-containing sensor histidine kinase [unclassified Rhizobium]NLR89355.1 HAMP domain-containing histidine kinase [Rhizobium sp. P28RR-XV]NLS21223.1 HAMP domain-containing histidine kinase [Rhizobium sp. P40RR-XXII]
MRIRSLRVRLILGAGVWIAVALVLAGVAIGYLFTKSVERGASADLSATMSRLVALINADARDTAPVLTGSLPDPRYDTPISGLYWQITDLGTQQMIRSRSLWDHVLKLETPNEGGQLSTVQGPVGQSLLAFSLTARFAKAKNERRFQVIVAQDRSILDEAITRFGRELAVALLILGVVLVLAAILQVRFGLSPFRKLRQDIEGIRKGAASSIDATYPLEVVPVVSEVNALLALQQKSMDFARARASDLAHGLKTPLAVLGTIAYELEDGGDKRSAATIIELTNEMRGRIDYQLRLVRLRQRIRMHALSASLSNIVPRAIAVLKKTRTSEQVDWVVNIIDGLNVDIDANDLIELVGVILENAAQWADSMISVQAKKDATVVELRISDDGPGIQSADLRSIGRRGGRFDETSPGTGLGLAIACEIVSLNNGTIAFERSQYGGLEVTIRLPVAG